MELGVSTHYNFEVITLSGQINQLKDSISLKSFINTLVAKKLYNIAISFKDMEFIDSSALNVLIYGKTQVEAKGGHFCLIEINEYIADVISVVGFNEVFTILEKKEDLKKIK